MLRNLPLDIIDLIIPGVYSEYAPLNYTSLKWIQSLPLNQRLCCLARNVLQFETAIQPARQMPEDEQPWLWPQHEKGCCKCCGEASKGFKAFIYFGNRDETPADAKAGHLFFEGNELLAYFSNSKCKLEFSHAIALQFWDTYQYDRASMFLVLAPFTHMIPRENFLVLREVNFDRIDMFQVRLFHSSLNKMYSVLLKDMRDRCYSCFNGVHITLLSKTMKNYSKKISKPITITHHCHLVINDLKNIYKKLLQGDQEESYNHLSLQQFQTQWISNSFDLKSTKFFSLYAGEVYKGIDSEQSFAQMFGNLSAMAMNIDDVDITKLVELSPQTMERFEFWIPIQDVGDEGSDTRKCYEQSLLDVIKKDKKDVFRVAFPESYESRIRILILA